VGIGTQELRPAGETTVFSSSGQQITNREPLFTPTAAAVSNFVLIIVIIQLQMTLPLKIQVQF
jgi:hypothetical protein